MAKDNLKASSSFTAKLAGGLGDALGKVAAMLAVAAAISLTATKLPDKFAEFLGISRPPVAKELPDRIRVLTDSLNAAARAIGDIESEIQERKELVDKLKRDAEIANNLKQLNKEQVDAVAQVLRSQIDREQKEGFWATQGIAFFYTILGVFLAEAFRWGSNRWKKIKEQSTP